MPPDTTTLIGNDKLNQLYARLTCNNCEQTGLSNRTNVCLYVSV